MDRRVGGVCSRGRLRRDSAIQSFQAIQRRNGQRIVHGLACCGLSTVVSVKFHIGDGENVLFER